jgi:hypothetical protein
MVRTNQHLVYADDVNIFGGSLHPIEINTEDLVVAGKEIHLEVYNGKSKYIVMSRGQDVGQNNTTESDKKSFERAFKCLGISATNQNLIQEEI